MKTNKEYSIAALLVVACLVSSGIKAAPRSTPVTVVNTEASPVPVTVQGDVTVTSEPQFVGFSNDAVQGDVGLVGMHGACAATYGVGARMCLSSEVFKTTNLQPVPSVPSGWIQHDDLYSLWTNFEENCLGWSSPLETGNVLSGERMNLWADREVTYPGGVRTPVHALCSQARPVACCK